MEHHLQRPNIYANIYAKHGTTLLAYKELSKRALDVAAWGVEL